MFQHALAGGFHHLAIGFTGHHRQFAIGLVEGDQGRVFLIEQEVRGVVEVPVTGFVDADQDRFEARTVEGIHDVAGRLQRHFMLSRAAAKNNTYPHLTHDPTSVLNVRLLTMGAQRLPNAR